MASPSRLARDAVRAALTAEVGGFNSRLAALLAAESLAPFEVDFSKGSKSFFQGALEVDSEIINYSQLKPDPIGLCLYAAGMIDAKETAHNVFSGPVEIRIDAYLSLRARDENSAGIESDDTETPLDCVEEAIMQTLHAPTEWGQGIIYNRDWKSDRSPLLLFEDGYQQRLSVTLAVFVRIHLQP